jgi:hypothetical protein
MRICNSEVTDPIRIQDDNYLRIHWLRIRILNTGCNWLEIYRGCALEPADGDRVRGAVQPAHEERVLPKQAGQLLLAVTG